MDSHLDDVLLRRKVEGALEFSLELAERQLALRGEVSNGYLLPEIVVNVIERLVDVLFFRKFFSVLMVILNDPHDAKHLVIV